MCGSESEAKEKWEKEAKVFGEIAGLMDNFQIAEKVKILRNCHLLAVGKIEWLIYSGVKIWHIGNVIAFSSSHIKELIFSREDGYEIHLKG